MVRRCLGCGEPGHRLDGRTSPAAVEIRRLRSLLGKKQRVGARAAPGEKGTKTGKSKEKTHKAYTVKELNKNYVKRSP